MSHLLPSTTTDPFKLKYFPLHLWGQFQPHSWEGSLSSYQLLTVGLLKEILPQQKLSQGHLPFKSKHSALRDKQFHFRQSADTEVFFSHIRSFPQVHYTFGFNISMDLPKHPPEFAHLMLLQAVWDIIAQTIHWWPL